VGGLWQGTEVLLSFAPKWTQFKPSGERVFDKVTTQLLLPLLLLLTLLLLTLTLLLLSLSLLPLSLLLLPLPLSLLPPLVLCFIGEF
jgi:hypothetical protein